MISGAFHRTQKTSSGYRDTSIALNKSRKRFDGNFATDHWKVDMLIVAHRGRYGYLHYFIELRGCTVPIHCNIYSSIICVVIQGSRTGLSLDPVMWETHFPGKRGSSAAKNLKVARLLTEGLYWRQC